MLLIRERAYCRWWKRQKTTMRDAQVWKAEVGGGVYVDGWIDVWMERVRERQESGEVAEGATYEEEI